MVKSSEVKEDLLIRLRKIKGQISGLEKMIERDTSCSDILMQISAVRAAVGKVGMIIMQNYMRDCFTCEKSEIFEDRIKELIKSFSKFMR
jgi:DNA-binding FrmR family transcriptional regulator